MITHRSTYEDCVREINESVQDVMTDRAYEGSELSEDEVFTDLAASLLLDARRPVAEEVCRTQLGFVPGQLLQNWKMRDRDKLELRMQQDRERKATKTREAAEERAAKAEAERRAALQAVRTARCPKCFTLPAANGKCLC